HRPAHLLWTRIRMRTSRRDHNHAHRPAPAWRGSQQNPGPPQPRPRRDGVGTRAPSRRQGARDDADGPTSSAHMSEPREAYRRRLAARRATAAAADHRSRQIAGLRGLTFFAFIAALILGALAWAAAPVLVFVALLFAHELVERRKARCLLAAEHYQRALRRLDDDWRREGVQHRDHV